MRQRHTSDSQCQQALVRLTPQRKQDVSAAGLDARHGDAARSLCHRRVVVAVPSSQRRVEKCPGSFVHPEQLNPCRDYYGRKKKKKEKETCVVDILCIHLVSEGKKKKKSTG